MWAGTGEPTRAAADARPASGIYSDDGGKVERALRQTSGAAAVPATRPVHRSTTARSPRSRSSPGNSNVISRLRPRGPRHHERCCGGADAIIPGAAHFGLYRSLNGGQTWQLVHQGAPARCTAARPDTVAVSGTPCSPRGARRVYIDPVDPNTVYVGVLRRGIWRSRSNGDPGTWEQIMAPVTPVPLTAGGGTERPEFDVVKLPNNETRMYVGVGGGTGAFARFRRNDNVRTAPAATVLTSWIDLTSGTQDTPGYSSFGYCDPQCSYDNYVFAPAHKFPNSGADADTVYLVGDNEYTENNWGPLSPRCCPDNPATGRSNGRAIGLSTNAGVHFTDMTEDASDNFYPVGASPRSPRPDGQPAELEAVLRGRGRRDPALERHLRRTTRATASSRRATPVRGSRSASWCCRGSRSA